MVIPIVSVIIPVYNSEKYIERCINSVLNQSYKNIEIIVVDDGSSDNTSHILNKYKNRIKYIYQENRGAAAARNIGLKASQGEYISFLDSDDYWHYLKLERQVSECQRIENFGICKCLSISNENELGIGQSEYIVYIDNSIERIFENPYYCPSTVIVKRSILDSVGLFDEKYKTAEDIDWFLRIAYNNPILVSINSPLVFKELRKNSLGNTISSFEDNLEVIDKFCMEHPDFLRRNKKLVENVKWRIEIKRVETLIWNRDIINGRRKLFLLLRKKPNIRLLKMLLKTYIKTIVNMIRKDK